MQNDNLIKSLQELLDDLIWLESEISGDLNKGPNYWKDKNPSKYKKMLSKLRRDRKTPGHKERGYQQVLQAKRREKGGPGTKSGQNGKKGHSSGRLKTKTGSAVKRYASAEKKHGKKMSMNRKNNNKGYGSGNVELISQKYNKGDEKYSKKAPEKRLKSKLKKLKKTLSKFENLSKAVVYKKVSQGSCTCGAHKVKSEGHYDWCDGLKPADGRKSMKELCQNYVFHQGDSVSPTGRVLGDHEVDDYIKRISDHFGSEEEARKYLEANYQDIDK